MNSCAVDRLVVRLDAADVVHLRRLDERHQLGELLFEAEPTVCEKSAPRLPSPPRAAPGAPRPGEAPASTLFTLAGVKSAASSPDCEACIISISSGWSGSVFFTKKYVVSYSTLPA